MNYRSVEELSRCVRRWCATLPTEIGLVVGVPRSGLLAANLVALYLNLPLADLDGFLAGRHLDGGARTRHQQPPGSDRRTKVLVVDDSYDSGTQMQAVRNKVAGTRAPDDMYFGAVYVSRRPARGELDFWAEIVRQPRAFEWNVMHHPRLRDACLDLDGVFCRDPSDAENDDGERYRRFLASVPASYVPPYVVGNIVTSRLERYRPLTEQWLESNGIRCRALHMLDGYSAHERRALAPHAEFKARIYAETDAWLFIESSADQAREIADRTGRAVFCTDTYSMTYPGGRLQPGPAIATKARIANLRPAARRLARAGLGPVLRRVNARAARTETPVERRPPP